jgi:ADP-ribose pyrophosphatase YjhB (NUDIX family)
MNVKDVYFVAVKAFIEDGNGNLLITKDRFGDWDLPGGRLREQDFSTPLEAVLQRKISEELGPAVTYTLGEPVVCMRHERSEILADGTRAPRRIFAIGYKARYTGGEIILGKNHEQTLWATPQAAVKHLTGGWLAGVKEYLSKVQKS